MFKDFKEFAMRGNVVDLAVGIIIGAAFGKIVSSFVADVLMPPIGIALGGVDFTNLVVVIQQAVISTDPAVAKEAVTINYGKFIQTVIDFIIIAFAIFVVVKGMNKMKKKQETEPEKPAQMSKEEILLTEIRDAIKNNKLQ